jgi:hypothetical protein
MKSSRENDEPKRDIPYTAIDDPRRTKERRLIELPRWMKSSTLKLEPSRLMPYTLIADPTRMYPRRESEDPNIM